MRIASSDAFWQAFAPREAAPAARATYPAAGVAGAGDAPDTSYWTPYDYFMIEREARALRRAALATTFTTLLGRLRRRV